MPFENLHLRHSRLRRDDENDRKYWVFEQRHFFVIPSFLRDLVAEWHRRDFAMRQERDASCLREAATAKQGAMLSMTKKWLGMTECEKNGSADVAFAMRKICDKLRL